MTDAALPHRRTISLQSPSGKALLTLPLMPAAVAAAAAIILAPRVTAAAALAALLRRLTLALDAGAESPAA